MGLQQDARCSVPVLLTLRPLALLAVAVFAAYFFLRGAADIGLVLASASTNSQPQRYYRSQLRKHPAVWFEASGDMELPFAV